MNMKRGLQAVLIAAALSAGALAPLPIAQAADVSVQFNAGNVAFGYSDGYWDRAHAWHPWPNTAARTSWRKANTGHYYSRAHTRYKGAGWRDSDHYWEHH
ncbi:MAG TPA: hypothetical protein VGL83_08770 [Stellaceae bacterium]|jgi:hypothetical protein